ncbi:MAG: hypothetical protein GY775_14380 [Candidatus Scalindua sp.]|nr:hypothetical protein [Candidatus Scalindua sp.]
MPRGHGESEKANSGDVNVIKSNILGRLGRVNQTLKKHNENDNIEHICNKDFERGVPSVPTAGAVTKIKTVNAGAVEIRTISDATYEN